MKASIALVLLLTVVFSGAQAKLTPAEPQVSAISHDDTTINSEPSGAILEAAYFSASQSPFAVGRLMPCRLQVRMFEKTRLAQSCN